MIDFPDAKFARYLTRIYPRSRNKTSFPLRKKKKKKKRGDFIRGPNWGHLKHTSHHYSQTSGIGIADNDPLSVYIYSRLNGGSRCYREPNLARIFENNDPQYYGYVQESAIHSIRGNQGKPVMCTRHGSVSTRGCGGGV